MATSGRPRFSALDHPTRKQLDELDALMQRMLALPVNPPEEQADPPKQQLSIPASRPPSEEETGKDDTAKQGLADNGTENKSKQEMLGTNYGVPSTEYRVPNTATPTSAFDTRYSVLRDPSSPSSGQPIITSPPPRPEAHVPMPRLAWPLRPLLWLNLAFDYGTTWLGPPGRWLHGPGGRALLGWAGLLLLLAALAWLVWDGLGWTW